jgi:phenylacetate-coenzyme A ligase PaaK-like adenylate-forming protein
VTTRASTGDRVYGALFASLLFPFWERAIRGRETLKHLSYLEKSQWLEHAERELNELAALTRLLRYAGDNVPYYRELFRTQRFDPRGVTSMADLAELPLLTRDIVRERYADLVDPAHRGKNFKKGTSGSTGKPLKFEYSKESECWRQAIKLRGYGWAGFRPGRKTFFYWAAVASGPPSLKIRIDRRLRRETFFDSMKQDEAARRAALDILRRTRPEVIVCYTQSCAQFARWIVDHGLRDWDDIPVICGAEAVLPGDRAILSKAFGPNIFETYGSRETMLMAAECEQHAGMHLSQENLVLEIVAGGKAAGPGQTGDVVVTDLHNYGMPMIRYVNGDVALSPSKERCACGRGLARLERVDGRRAATLLDKEGNGVPGIVFHVLFSDARRELVRQFQAVQSSNGQVVLKIVRGRDFAEDAFQSITGRFSEYLRGLPFKVEFHEFIAPHQGSGKLQTIIVEEPRGRFDGH